MTQRPLGAVVGRFHAGMFEEHKQSVAMLEQSGWEPSRGRLSGLRPPAGFWSTLALIYPSVFHHLPNVQCYFENVQRLIAAVEGELNDYSTAVHRNLCTACKRHGAKDFGAGFGENGLSGGRCNSENRTDLLNYGRHQASETGARNANRVHNSGITDHRLASAGTDAVTQPRGEIGGRRWCGFHTNSLPRGSGGEAY